MDDALEAWAKLDSARALHPSDHRVLVDAEPVRSLVLELLTAGAERDLWNACARLGRVMAEAGASPSLASATIDHAAMAVGLADPARIAPARASLVEGYVASVRDTERTSSAAAWDYPSCVVSLEDGVAAVACGHPTDDADALTVWAEGVARGLRRTHVKRAVLAGSEAARSELASVLELIGIALGPSSLGPERPKKKSWLPWRR